MNVMKTEECSSISLYFCHQVHTKYIYTSVIYVSVTSHMKSNIVIIFYKSTYRANFPHHNPYFLDKSIMI